MCDSLEVGGSGEADIIPEAHKKKPVKGHSFFLLLCFFFCFFLSFVIRLMRPQINSKLSFAQPVFLPVPVSFFSPLISTQPFLPVILTFLPMPAAIPYGVNYEAVSWGVSAEDDCSWHLMMRRVSIITSQRQKNKIISGCYCS